MATTVLDLISSSMRLLGWLAAGQTPSAEEGADYLVVLNQMIAAFNKEGTTVYARKIESCPLSSKSNLTIGPGAVDFDRPRPVLIEAVSAVSGALSLPVKILTAAEWSEIKQKSIVGTVPEGMYPDYAWPVMNLKFWPISEATAELTVIVPLAAFAALTDEIDLPEGYEEMLRTNLAVRLAPEVGELNQVVAALAVSSKQAIQQFNAKTQGIAPAASAAQ